VGTVRKEDAPRNSRNSWVEPSSLDGTYLLNLSCRHKCIVVCSAESVCLGCLGIGLSVGHLFIFFTYFIKFNNNSESSSGVWVFSCLAVLCGSITCLFVTRVLKMVCCTQKKQVDDKKCKKDPIKSRCTTRLNRIQVYYTSFSDINGKYYLIKMHASCMLGTIQQVVNIRTIYSCVFPVGICVSMAVILIIKSLMNVRSILQLEQYSQITRDRKLLLELVIDMFFCSFPLAYIWWVLRLPILVSDMLLLTVVPTLSLITTSHDIWEDLLTVDSARFSLKGVLYRNELVKKSSMTRQSVLRQNSWSIVVQEQLNSFPWGLKQCFTIFNISVALLCFIIIIFQLASLPSNELCTAIHTSEVWRGCDVQVPFCENPLLAKCDCASLFIFNYSQEQFPKSFGEMSSLIYLGVYMGKLKALPNRTGVDFPKMMKLEIIGNQLNLLPNSIGNLKRLLSLDIGHNALQELPESTSELRSLITLSARNNQLLTLPKNIGKLYDLKYLMLHNNRLRSLPESLSELQHLLVLTVQNNFLRALPETVGRLKALDTLLAWNNKMAKVPVTIGNMKALQLLDFRRNNLTSLPSSINALDGIYYFNVAGNPICARASSYRFPDKIGVANDFCQHQCSVECPSPWLGDGQCDDNLYIYEKMLIIRKVPMQPSISGCNSESCHFDEGDCQ
jgi:hypothetical protein